MPNKLCVIKSVDIPRWHGKTPKEYKAQPHLYQAAIDSQTSKYRFVMDDSRKDAIAKETGYDLSLSYKIGVEHKLFTDPKWQVELLDGTTIFNLNDITQEIKCAIAKGLPMVAPSQSLLADYPGAEYYVFSEEEVEEEQAKLFSKKEDAYELVGKMSIEAKMNLVLIVGNKVIDANSKNAINAAIGQVIEKDIDNFLIYARKSPAEINVRAVVIKAVNQGLIENDRINHMFKRGDIELGRSLEEAISYFSDRGNKDLLDSLQNLVNNNLILKPVSDDSERDGLPPKTKGKQARLPTEEDAEVPRD